MARRVLPKVSIFKNSGHHGLGQRLPGEVGVLVDHSDDEIFLEDPAGHAVVETLLQQLPQGHGVQVVGGRAEDVDSRRSRKPLFLAAVLVARSGGDLLESGLDELVDQQLPGRLEPAGAALLIEVPLELVQLLLDLSQELALKD